MKNPFVSVSEIDQTEYLSERCSLNRMVLKKLPLYGIEDEIEGMTFPEIFSTPALIAEVHAVSRQLGVDLSGKPDYLLPQMVDESLHSDNARYRQMAKRVVKKFGNRLGLLLLTLKTGERENRLGRGDWDDDCWAYWRSLDTVILTGGLASSMLGRRFKECIHTVFDTARVKAYRIVLFDNGSYVGMMGLAQQLMQDDSASLVLDLGHTGCKRAVIRKSGGELTEFIPQDSLPSLYMQSRFDNEEEKRAAALRLHRYLVNTITASYRVGQTAASLSDTVLISIANYTHNGLLNSRRGGYAKLSLLGSDYAKVLEEDLSGELHRDIKIRLVHDSTASALYFSDYERSACITLGTGFGVGFTDINPG
ncbi:hypothetical protein [Ruminococcus sp.]|uniref:hypothetical protein n=1 Tax=Ruminococcus sp. TaxID=41978 RepID=UPI0038909341